MEDKINAFEIWIFQHMFRILYLDRETNIEVLEMAKVKQTLLRLYMRGNYNILDTF